MLVVPKAQVIMVPLELGLSVYPDSVIANTRLINTFTPYLVSCI